MLADSIYVIAVEGALKSEINPYAKESNRLTSASEKLMNEEILIKPVQGKESEYDHELEICILQIIFAIIF